MTALIFTGTTEVLTSTSNALSASDTYTSLTFEWKCNPTSRASFNSLSAIPNICQVQYRSFIPDPNSQVRAIVGTSGGNLFVNLNASLNYGSTNAYRLELVETGGNVNGEWFENGISKGTASISGALNKLSRQLVIGTTNDRLELEECKIIKDAVTTLFWDANSSSTAPGAVVMTDTVSGNNGNGAGFPTDGSAWLTTPSTFVPAWASNANNLIQVM